MASAWSCRVRRNARCSAAAIVPAARRPASRSRCLALDQRLVAQVLAVEMEQVEDVEEHAFGPLPPTVRPAAPRRRRRPCRRARRSRRRSRPRRSRAPASASTIALPKLPVQSSPERVNSFTLPPDNLRLDAVAVELHLVQPFLAGRRRRSQRRQRGSMKSALAAAAVACLAWRLREAACLALAGVFRAVRLPAATSSMVRPGLHRFAALRPECPRPAGRRHRPT